jgi:hypothetical protein
MRLSVSTFDGRAILFVPAFTRVSSDWRFYGSPSYHPFLLSRYWVSPAFQRQFINPDKHAMKLRSKKRLDVNHLHPWVSRDRPCVFEDAGRSTVRSDSRDFSTNGEAFFNESPFSTNAVSVHNLLKPNQTKLCPKPHSTNIV